MNEEAQNAADEPGVAADAAELAERTAEEAAEEAAAKPVFEAPTRGSAEELLDAGAHDELDAMRHSTAHVMAEAVMDLFPGAKLGIGPAIEEGFYYDFELPRPLAPDDLTAIEARMAESVGQDHAFVRDEMPLEKGRASFADRGQPYKVEIIDDLAARARASDQPPPAVTTYTHGAFVDLCRGPHVASTGKIGPFKLLSVAGAYWRGKSDRPMLQRIYGTVWPTQADLDRYLWRLEEARKRDHRRLGLQLDLFSFHPEISPGAAFWHPKGQLLYRILEDAMREEQKRRGYLEIATPILVHRRLWDRSGHWDLYRDNMFVLESEEQTFSLKPMNCPESTFVYRSRKRSYRDFPLRYAEYGRLHRNELSGTLSGLLRVRQMVQDDAHIYVRPDQLEAEIAELVDLSRTVYGWFGFTPRFRLGTRPAKALGDAEVWKVAEASLQRALEAGDVSFRVEVGEGSFYGPKIDILIDDALGREWQTATIQEDRVMLPERFDLTYTDEQGREVRPVAIHRAIYGTFERFIGLLVEHFAGALPMWCAPVQAVVVPIAARHNEAARQLGVLLAGRGVRVEVDDSDLRMQNKIRLAQEQKVPYMLVLGDREVEARTATPRRRSGEVEEAIAWDALADRLAREAASRRPD